MRRLQSLPTDQQPGWLNQLINLAQRRNAPARREEHLERELRRTRQALAAAEKRRAQAERLAAVGRLATGMAHELNNPLAYVRSNLEMIAGLAHKHQDGNLLDMANESLDGVLRLAQIVSDMRGFASEPTDGFETLQPAEAIAAAMRLASVPLRTIRHVDVDVAPALPLIISQSGRLVQVLVNLLANAADALEGVAGSRLRIRAYQTRKTIRISVDDNGRGVPPELTSRIFDPFFSTRDGKGMGIGLALSREFAGQLGGTLELAPSELGGACFIVELPIDTLAARSAAA